MFLSLLLLAITLKAQSAKKEAKAAKYVYKEIVLHLDNDLFSIINPTDSYYSWGTFLGFRMVLDPDKRWYQNTAARWSRLHKASAGISLRQEGYMPRNNFTTNINLMDRPWAGLLYLQPELQLTFHRHTFNFALQTGVMGSASGSGDFQVWLHDLLNLEPANGWDVQIPNQLIFNFLFTGHSNIYENHFFHVFNTLEAQLGTELLGIKDRIGIRVGLLDAMHSSAYFGNRISRKEKNRELAVYGDATIGGALVVYDNTIEGHRNEEYIVLYDSLNHAYWSFSFGVNVSWKRFSFRFYTERFSPKTDRTKKHDYGGAIFNWRF